MKRFITVGLGVVLIVATQMAAQAQRGYTSPYPNYPVSPPGGGYAIDERGGAIADVRQRQ